MEWRDGYEEQDVDNSRSMHGSALSEIVRLRDAIALTYWTGAQEKRIGMLSRAMESLLKPLKKTADGSFEVEVKSVEVPSHFPMIVSYICVIQERKDMLAAGHGAE